MSSPKLGGTGDTELTRDLTAGQGAGGQGRDREAAEKQRIPELRPWRVKQGHPGAQRPGIGEVGTDRKL